jgi:transcription antitermination factor NusA-like protein
MVTGTATIDVQIEMIGHVIGKNGSNVSKINQKFNVQLMVTPTRGKF